MADSFFKQRFNAAKCKTLLKLTIPRIKLLRNRREIQLKQMRREIAKLIETGQEATARIRVEHIMREEKMMAAQEIVELFCELIAVRLPIIESQKECPLDLKEAISSVCFAAPRCADLPELLQVQLLFASKYGKEFVSAATELLPECGVNRQLVELLSIRAPAPDLKLKLLKEIAEEHQLDWDPSSSENELLKPHEDLLNGPSHFVSGSQDSLPKDKLDQAKDTILESPAVPHEHTDSDDDFDIVNLPEVPKQQPLHSNKGTASAPEMFPFPDSALSELDNSEESNSLAPEEHVVQEKSFAAAGPVGDKQFVPFISPPSFPTRAEQNSPPAIPKTESDNVDLSDVLAAARAAAETAERAAAAARSAANIAQLRISGLVKKKNDDEVSGSTTVASSPHLEHVKSDVAEKTDYGSSVSTSPTQNDVQVSSIDPCSVGTNNHHQPQRLPSMDDETYFSYPNLFSSQNSNVSSHSDSFRDSK